MKDKSIFSVRIILGLFICLTLVGVTYRISNAGRSEQVGDNIEDIKEIAIKKIEQAQTSPWPCNDFEVGELRQDDLWAFLNLICWPPEQIDPEVFVPEIILLAFAHYENNEWDVYLEGTPEFLELIGEVPDSLVDPESKQALASMPSQIDEMNNPVTILGIYTTGLPWQPGDTWRYNQSLHGSPACALDFGVPQCGVSNSVYPAESGTIVWAYETCMLIRRPNSTLDIGYQHISSSDISNWNAGDWINSTDLIGYSTTNSGCSGSSGGHHVHFWMEDSAGCSTNGSTLGGWTLDNPLLIKGDETRSPSTACSGANNWIYYEPDTTPPTLAFTIPTEDQWYNTHESLSWTITDSSSGVDYYHWGWDDNTPDNQVEGDSGSINLGNAGQGQHTLYIQAWDNAGNSTNVISRGWFGYDTIPPDVPSILAGCTAYDDQWQNTCNDGNFSWSATDPNGSSGSGVGEYAFLWTADPDAMPDQWGGATSYDPGPVSPPNSWGQYYLNLNVRDVAGNERFTSFGFWYDGVSPYGNPLVNKGAETVSNVNVLVGSTGQDMGSGLAGVHLSNNNLTWQPFDFADPLIWSLAGFNRTWNPLYVQLEDAAGNISPVYDLQVCLNVYPPQPSSNGYRLWEGGVVSAGGHLVASNYKLIQSVGGYIEGSSLASANYRLDSGFQNTSGVNPESDWYTPFQCGLQEISERVFLPILIR